MGWIVKRVFYSYSEFIEDLKRLISKIDIEFDTIIGVARGGLTIAHFLGEYYNIRDVFSINSIGYSETKKLNNIKIFNIPNLIKAKRVLVVDDIVDSGDTLLGVLKELKENYPTLRIYTASIFYKREAKLKPDFFAKETKDWIDFFWTKELRG